MTSPRIPDPTQLPASETATPTAARSRAVTPSATPTAVAPTATPAPTASGSELPARSAAAEDVAPTAPRPAAEAAAETGAEAAAVVAKPTTADAAAPFPQSAGPAVPPTLIPTQASERYMILDTLRGFAILGIALANYPELSLYRFLPADAAAALPASAWDRAINFIVHSLVDGKFYTIFSLLFGIGFSIILQNITRKGGRVLPLFMRRMALLALIGLAHLLFIWSGDILLLYALMGMLLACFRNLSDRTLLSCALAFLLLPIGIDAACEYANLHPAAFFVQLQQQACAHSGITPENFATWLRDADSYSGMFDFLIQGAAVRAQEFIDGNRYFKVLGLFLLGFLIGRHRLYARLAEHRRALRRITLIGGGIGLILARSSPGAPSTGSLGALPLTASSTPSASIPSPSPTWVSSASPTCAAAPLPLSAGSPPPGAWPSPTTSCNPSSAPCSTTASASGSAHPCRWPALNSSPCSSSSPK